jgi:hypothetical protein
MNGAKMPFFAGHPSESAAIINLGSINSYVTYPPALKLSDGFNPYPHGALLKPFCCDAI